MDTHAWAEVSPLWDKYCSLLPAYVLTAEFSQLSETGGAKCTVALEYGTMHLSVCANWCEFLPEQRERVFLHEVMHCYTLPVYVAAHRSLEMMEVDDLARKLVGESLRFNLELSNESLTQMVIELTKEHPN